MSYGHSTPFGEAGQSFRFFCLTRTRRSALSLIAQSGSRAPHPSADLRFVRFETPIALSGDGRASFFARTRDKENDAVQGSGLWIADKGGSTAAANAGGLALSNDAQVAFSAQSFEAPFGADAVVNAAGVTPFRGFVDGAGVDEFSFSVC